MADNKFPVFVQEGQITQAGLHLIEFIEAQYLPYDLPGEQANMQALNSLSGPFSEYYTVVAKMGAKTPKSWLESFPQSAKNAYEVMKYVEEKAAAEEAEKAKLTETVDKTTALEAALNELKETLNTKVVELEAANKKLVEENEALKKTVAPVAKGKKKTEPVVEATETDEAAPEETPAEEA